MRRFICLLMLGVFSISSLIQECPVYADGNLLLPLPGARVDLSSRFEPVLIKGLRVHPENPFRLDFIIDHGNSSLDLKPEVTRLIKYFLTSLTIPEKDLWVNLSPYEKNRMISADLGQTEMGVDMLAQDYILKQLTASLIDPQKDLGRIFWNKVYTKARKLYGTTQIPVNTFNKVWIVADRADVFEHGNVAYVAGAHLKVMLEEDYQALYKGVKKVENNTHALGAQVVREVILPQIENEVNNGKNFAPLRQMFYSMILASWYKLALKNTIVTQIYGNQDKVRVGIHENDPTQKERIYQRYVQAYKKGVFNYIKEEQDPVDQQTVSRKYFSGGAQVWGGNLGRARIVPAIPNAAMPSDRASIATVDLAPQFGITIDGSKVAIKIFKLLDRIDSNKPMDHEKALRISIVLSNLLMELLGVKGEDDPLDPKHQLGSHDIKTDQEWIYLGEQLRAYWHKKGLNKEIGSLNPYLVQLNYNFMSFKILQESERKIQLLAQGGLYDRLLGNWNKAVGVALHNRAFIAHSEKDENGNLRIIDNEILASAGRQFIIDYLQWQKSPELERLHEEGYSEPVFNDLLLWGLAVILDPANFVPAKRVVRVRGQHHLTPDSSLDYKATILRYALNNPYAHLSAGSGVSMFKNLHYSDGHPIEGQEIGRLISEVLSITPEQWEVKGMQDPWRVALKYLDDFVFSMGKIYQKPNIFFMITEKQDDEKGINRLGPDIKTFQEIIHPDRKEFAKEIYGWPEFQELFANRAMSAQTNFRAPNHERLPQTGIRTNGGIDLDSSKMNFHIQKRKNQDIDFNPVILERFRREGFDGFEFEIKSITPATNQSALGLK